MVFCTKKMMGFDGLSGDSLSSSLSDKVRAHFAKKYQICPLFAGTSRNIYPLATVQGCLATTFRCSFHLWQQIM